MMHAPTGFHATMNSPAGVAYGRGLYGHNPSGGAGRYGLAALADEEVAAASGAGLIGLMSSGLYGGAIGGLASAKWKGAATGALAGVGFGGISYGSVFAAAGEWVPAAGFIALGLGGLGWAFYRWNKSR